MTEKLKHAPSSPLSPPSGPTPVEILSAHEIPHPAGLRTIHVRFRAVEGGTALEHDFTIGTPRDPHAEEVRTWGDPGGWAFIQLLYAAKLPVLTLQALGGSLVTINIQAGRFTSVVLP